MREEEVTKSILSWLSNNSWEIVCYDFPQSGTGKMLHPNDSTSKNDGSTIPDIIAVKGKTAVYFENKDRFYEPDFDKLQGIRDKGNYSDDLSKLLKDYVIDNIFYGIGFPDKQSHIDKSQSHLIKIDFLVTVDKKRNINIEYDNYNIY